ncbi:MAG: hypothetical protein ACI87N_001199 [Flavobacteriales bacterium]|jgi:hypothetical protein
MKVRPSIEYWDTLDTSIRERFLIHFYRKSFYFGLIILITVTIESVITVLDIKP